MNHSRLAVLTLAASLLGAPALAGNKVVFKDPTGDDNGPGKYTYPTDTVYKRGSFDLTEFQLVRNGSKADVSVTLNTGLEDPWKMGSGFSVQMVFIFIDTDGKEGSGFTQSLPGLNVEFAPADAWEKVIVLSPQASSRVKSEVGTKAGAMKDAILIPTRTKGSGRTITATVDVSSLSGEPTDWRYQVLVQSNEGFPAGSDLLTRRVNEYEGQHRFGGGTDTDCDPHVMDLLAGAGKGEASEIKAQHELLKYECAEDGSVKKRATLTMVGGAPRPAAALKPAVPAPAVEAPKAEKGAGVEVKAGVELKVGTEPKAASSEQK